MSSLVWRRCVPGAELISTQLELRLTGLKEVKQQSSIQSVTVVNRRDKGFWDNNLVKVNHSSRTLGRREICFHSARNLSNWAWPRFYSSKATAKRMVRNFLYEYFAEWD